MPNDDLVRAVGNDGSARASSPMTAQRWREVDAILRGALACEPHQRDGFVRSACGDDEDLRREVASLLASHDAMAADFLERPLVASLGEPVARDHPTDRAAAALAEALAGRYEIEGEIARGGMATVYVARDLRHGRRVAIKVMRGEVTAAVGAERFLEEIRVTALLQHPHILPLFESGSSAGLLWYVMPFVDGETLRSRLAREGRLPVDEAIRIAGEVADALDYAHARGIVHRDVKPENVLLQSGHALVADFGIALALEQAGGERLTRTGLTVGTPQYMAPEQAAGERAIDARVDVYALGAMLHEMLGGEPPFGTGSRQAVLQRMLLEAPPALAARRSDVSASLDAAVRRALAKRPDDRFPTASAFAAALVAPDGRIESPAAAPRLTTDAARASSTRRVVTARVAVYAALAGIAAGLMGGWGLAHSSTAEGWANNRPAARRWSSNTATVDAAVAANVTGAGDASNSSKDDLSLVVVDRAGRLERTIDANRPWTPRFSPDGRRVAYGAFGPGRSTSDLWMIDLAAGTTQRLTDDDRDSNDPQWSPDGATVAFSVSAPGGKDLAALRPTGGSTHILASREGTQFPSDWLHDGSALIVTEEAANGHDILVQPADGSRARPYAATAADETTGRVSPDGRWIAYTSDESGRAEVYLDSYPYPKQRVMISQRGGIHPVWRGDGRELFYWRADTLVSVQLGAGSRNAPPEVGETAVLFAAPYQISVNTMYDVAPDGKRFVIVRSR